MRARKEPIEGFLNILTENLFVILKVLLISLTEYVQQLTRKPQKCSTHILQRKVCLNYTLCFQISILSPMKPAQTSTNKAFCLVRFFKLSNQVFKIAFRKHRRSDQTCFQVAKTSHIVFLKFLDTALRCFVLLCRTSSKNGTGMPISVCSYFTFFFQLSRKSVSRLPISAFPRSCGWAV